MRRKAMLAAALGLLVVGCQPQSEFDRCMEHGMAIQREFVRVGVTEDNKYAAVSHKHNVWTKCAEGRK